MFGRDKSRRRELRRLVADEQYDGIEEVVDEDPELARELVELVADQADDIGENASHAIGLMGRNHERAPQVIYDITPRLVELMGHRSRLTRLNAVLAVYELASCLQWEDCEECVLPFAEEVVELLSDDDTEVREWAAASLQAIAEAIEDSSEDFADLKAAIPVLKVLLRDRAASAAAIATLRAIGHRQPAWIQGCISDLREVLPHEKDVANVNGAALLSYLAEHDPDTAMLAEPALKKLLAEAWERIKEPAAIALGFLASDTQGETVKRILTEYVAGSREYRRETAARALRNLSSRRFTVK